MKAYPYHRWIAARERAQLEREKNRQAVLRELNEVLTKLEKKYTWSALILFGSATKRGCFGEFSDVDIAIDGLAKKQILFHRTLKSNEKKYRLDREGRARVEKLLSEYLRNQRPEVLFGYLFGSFLLESGFSDIDVGVYLEKNEGHVLDQEFAMEAALEKVLHYPVDVRVLNHAPVSFSQNVIRSGDLLLDRNPQIRADFEGLTLKKYFDFKRFRAQYLQEVVNAPI